MNAPFRPDLLTLDRLAIGTKACVAVEPLHLGPFGRDPIAIRVGRMTVAIRRKHAAAISVTPIQ
jgi:ferrous iron transport protein A